MKRILTGLFLFTLLCSVLAAESRKVVIDGTPVTAATFGIVVPASPTPSEKRSAEELQRYWQQMTGEKLAIAGEKLPSGTEKGFFIGRFEVPGQPECQTLGDDGIGIFSVPRGVILQGNARGCLYSMYTFLQDYLGCRWFTNDCIVIPDEGEVRLEKLSNRHIPILIGRGLDEPNSRDADFGVPNKLNDIHMQWTDPGWGGHLEFERGIGYVHTFSILVNPSKYFKDHPEYYSLRNGQRVPGTAYEGQLCLTNPEVLEIAIEYILGNLKLRPDTKLICVSQNDNNNFCTCDKCTELAKQEGSQSGPIIHFVNAIAERVNKEYPNVMFQTIAYTYSRKPPKKVKANPNVIVQLCSIECCFSHPLAECPQNRLFMKDLERWGKCCSHLAIWHYKQNWHHSQQPFPDLYTIAPDVKTLIANSARFLYSEMAYFEPIAEMSRLRSYILAQVMWNPDCDTGKLIHEFCAAYYGKAAPMIEQYINELHELAGKSTKHMNSGEARSYLYFPGFWEKADQLFDQAEAAVKDDPVLLKRVQIEHMAVYYTLATLDPQADGADAAREKFLEYAHAMGVKYIGETDERSLAIWEKNTAKKSGYPTATIRKFAKSPVIDGKVDTDEWNDMTELALVDPSGTQPTALRKGSVLVGYTEDALYFASKFRRDIAATSTAEAGSHDDVKMFFVGDVFEIFLGNADLSSHVHLAINEENKRFDALNTSSPELYDPKWESAVSSDGNYWYCEVKIPFRELWGKDGSIAPDKVQNFRANFCREFYAPNQELQMWNPPGFHKPNSFGKLVYQK